MKRFLILLAVLGALIATVPPSPVQSQSLATIPNHAFLPFGAGLSADDTDVALVVRYVGTGAGASTNVAVSAAGDLTFLKTGVAVDEFECPVSGALGGVIDVSDTACDTMGEVVDVINASTNWRAFLVGALRADSSNDTLLTISATDATAANGLGLKFDTDVAKIASIAFMPAGNDINFFIAGTGSMGAGGFRPEPFSTWRGAVSLIRATSTFASGTSTIKVYSVRSTIGRAGKGAETVTTLWSIAGGATTAEKLLDYSETPLYGKAGEKLLVRLENSAAMATISLHAYGALYLNP
jgi:hypothetical protein